MARITQTEAIDRIQKGEIVAIPTETVYGLAASLSCQEAVEKIFLWKGRPRQNPLIVHLASPEPLFSYLSEIPSGTELLANTFWPGPLTLVLPIFPEKIPAAVRANLPTAAFRIPALSEVRALLEVTGPLVMPSANRSGSPSATSAIHVENDFGADFPVWDLGPSLRGLESTILYPANDRWHLLRRGSLSSLQLERILGYSPEFLVTTSERPLSPGQLFRHYAPRAKLVLSEVSPPVPVDAIVGFSDRTYSSSLPLFLLGRSDDPEEVGRRLYDVLRSLDRAGVDSAWVDIQVPSTGLWETICERLERAATQ